MLDFQALFSPIRTSGTSVSAVPQRPLRDGEVREFYFTPELRRLLEKQRARTSLLEQALGAIVRPVFWRAKGPGVGRDGQRVGLLRKAWLRACEEAGVPGRLFHDLRRTAVRNLEAAGVPRSAAMAMVGHRTESIYRRYAIADAALLRMGAAKLGRLHAIEAALGGVGPGKIAKLRSAKEQDLEQDRGGRARKLVAWDGVEPPTRGFSARSQPDDKDPEDAK
jgi:integrase